MKRFLAWSMAYAMVTMGLFFLTLDFSVVDGEAPSRWQSLLRPVVEILMQPAMSVWSWLGPKVDHGALNLAAVSPATGKRPPGLPPHGW